MKFGQFELPQDENFLRNFKPKNKKEKQAFSKKKSAYPEQQKTTDMDASSKRRKRNA